MKIFQKLSFLAVLIVLGLVPLSGCEKEGPAEKAGRNIDKSVEEFGDKAEEFGDDVKDAANDAADEIEDTAEDVADDIKDATN